MLAVEEDWGPGLQSFDIPVISNENLCWITWTLRFHTVYPDAYRVDSMSAELSDTYCD